jgi:hypothetical protein
MSRHITVSAMKTMLVAETLAKTAMVADAFD